MLNYNPIFPKGVLSMSQQTTVHTLTAYFQSLADEEKRYICPEDLATGIQYGILRLSKKDRRILTSGGMIRAAFNDSFFLCPVAKPLKKQQGRG